MSNSWTLICAGVVSTKMCPSKCGKLNVRSFVLTSTLKMATLRISSFDKVMVQSVNKSDYIAKNISSSSSMIPSIR
jgi:hypothetical protein